MKRNMICGFLTVLVVAVDEVVLKKGPCFYFLRKMLKWKLSS